MKISDQVSNHFIHLRDRILTYMDPDTYMAEEEDVVFNCIGPCFAMARTYVHSSGGSDGHVKLWPRNVLRSNRSEWTPCFEIEWTHARGLVLHAYDPGEWEQDLNVTIDVEISSRSIARQAAMDKDVCF